MKKLGNIMLLLTLMFNFAAIPGASWAQEKIDIATLPMEELSEDEIQGILLIREEEKLARDVYRFLEETWNLKIFSNISRSEQTHMGEISRLIDKYGLQDPVKDDTPGVFSSPEVSRLYQELIERGKTSELEALKIGATVEELDIADIENILSKADNQDLRIVLLNLVKGSRNHLRSFTRQITKRGSSFQPAYISDSMYEAIINTEQEQYEITDPEFLFNY
ncbi:MAG TPA: DUF2202 domain-containing protein [Synergistales bacterium]|nr:DUF2202 domain-containing protein [Synergistales bacterium]